MAKDIQLAEKLLHLDSKYKMHEIVTGPGGSMERERNARETARRDLEEGDVTGVVEVETV